ncbi:MAG: MASE3 domain-containing protein [Gallionella sp.]|nr:MASE3 domain-containing protein [Gallionella sp.]
MSVSDLSSKFRLHPSYLNTIRRISGFLTLLALIQLIAWLLPPFFDVSGIPNYLPLHVLLETSSVVIAMMVFSVGWNNHSPNLPGNIVLLACLFLGIGFLDLSHTISYQGMPAFFTENNADKQLNFWLSGRFLAALALLLVAIRPWHQITSTKTRYILLASMISFVLLINWLVLFHQDDLPRTFIPGVGLTPLKKGIEYLIIAINILTALILWLKMRSPQRFNVPILFGAVCVMGMGEFFFTLYTTMTGGYNVLGHIYKVISYLFIYRAIVIETIERPYVDLRERKKELATLYSVSQLFADTNKATEKLLQASLSHIQSGWLYPEITCAKLVVNDQVFSTKNYHPTKWGLAADIVVSGRLSGVLEVNYLEERPFVDEGPFLFEERTLINSLASNLGDMLTRRQADQLLHDSQITAKIGSYIIHFSSEVLDCTDTIDRIFGITKDYPHSFSGWLATVHPDFRQQMSDYMQVAIRNKKSINIQYKIVRPSDYAQRWIHTIGQPVFDSEGNAVNITGTSQDITDQKEAELRIKADEERFRAFIQESPIPMAVRESSGKIVLLNDAFTRVFGYSLDDLPTLNDWWKRAYPNLLYRQWVMDSWTNSLEHAAKYGKSMMPIEVDIHCRDGSVRTCLVSGVNISESGGGELLAVMNDITEIKRAEKEIKKNAKNYRDLADNGQVLIWTADTDKLCNYFNKIWLEFTGRTIEQEMGNGWAEVIHPDDLQRCLDAYTTAFNRREAFRIDYRLKHHTGEYRWIENRATPRFDEQGTFVGYIGHCLDIDDRYKANETFRKLSKAVEQSPSSVVITNADGDIEFVNNVFVLISGYSANEVIGKNPRILKSGKTPKSVYQDMWGHLKRGDAWAGELTNKRKDGSEFIESVVISPVQDEAGKIISYIAIKTDVTDKKLAEERIEKLAHFDSLTELPNRNLLLDRFNYAASLAHRSKEKMAVMFLDLDHFKNINDTLGHSVGDQLLKELAKRMKENLRDGDTISRTGGDEFILVLPNTDSHGAALVAGYLIDVVTQSFKIGAHELIVTPSIGITLYPDDGLDFETLSKNADAAMYRVKNSGRNGYHFYTPELQEKTARTLQLSTALRSALSNNELHLLYQPQLAIEDGHVIGAEALLRWEQPELGTISPAEFIPLAEESGQIIPIGEWVIRTAAKQMKEWIDAGLTPMIVAVNISSVQFRQSDISTKVTRILDDVGLPHEYFEMELTEAVAMDDPVGVIAIMDALYDCNIQMSIDDFGTGYSSLSYLKKFKVSKLKIDQSFVRDITHDSEDKAIVTAIINMAKGLGIKTIAEGVETAAQLSFLRMQGCDEVQGYYFSKPVSPKEFEVFAKKNTWN